MIVVIDYNVGNVKSVCNAFRHIGCEVELSCNPEAVKNASGIVLPGVAAFGYAINALGSLAEVIKEVALNGKPLLGICVGYQMLFETSIEYGKHNGLGLTGIIDQELLVPQDLDFEGPRHLPWPLTPLADRP